MIWIFIYTSFPYEQEREETVCFIDKDADDGRQDNML